ncbi:hypothetical protein [Agromyces silvae]|uniref:hypothetical protein n=1 Tax=Agromyces silvae TaxID=3388266 RepID=UPI00280B6CC4|nr:hypothetical protein [Agromyces protaetiae]
MNADYSDRRFQLWEYRVSHGSLLIRSPRGLDATRSVDFIFVGVEYLAVPRVFRGLSLDAHRESDRVAVTAEFGPFEIDRLRVLVSAGKRFPIVAAGLRVEEHEGDIFDSPFAERTN